MIQSNTSKGILLSVIGIAILVIAVVGVSFAYFTYARNGKINRIGTGEIHFTTDQSMVNINNIFPMVAGDINENTTSNVVVTTVTITGWTNYEYGLAYTVTVDDVDLKGLPIRAKVFKDGLLTSNAKITQYDGDIALTPGAVLATGVIPKMEKTNTIASGTIKIITYLDADQILITDTDDLKLADSMGDSIMVNKMVLSTSEWNNLAYSPAKLKIKVTSTDGNVLLQ